MPQDEVDFQFLTENIADVVCRVSREMVVQYVSPSSLDVLGWMPEELVGTGPGYLVHPEDLPLLLETAARNDASDGENKAATVRMRKKDGSFIWAEVKPRVVRDPQTGEPREAVIVIRDVSERKQLEEKLAALAMTDGLTGLRNRRAFDEALDREWRRTLREGTQMSLLMLDLDHFKSFNDLYGHQVGDDCLRAVAASVAGAVRNTDTAARYGGEEIAVILPMTEGTGAMDAAGKVLAAVERLRLTHEGNPEGGGWVSVSIGAATAMAREGGTIRMPETLVLAADSALYRAKHAGRNRVELGLLIAPQELETA